VWAQIHDQDGVHGCAANGASPSRESCRAPSLMDPFIIIIETDLTRANDPREEFDLS
jgi:hypothetical protein